jgi:uncharacterized repeat protein (TIGR01451 family)
MRASKTTNVQAIGPNRNHQGTGKMKTIKTNQRMIFVALITILAISGAAVSSLVVQRAGAAPNAPVSNGAAEGALMNRARVNVAKVFEPQPFTFGTCDTAGPIEVESSGGTVTPTAYASLKLAFDAINAGTHTGTITIDVCGDSTETATAALNDGATAPASWTTMSISPAGGAARTITGAIAAGSPLVNLNGADNVTINGLNTGGNSLTISNTTIGTTAGTGTIRFIGDASGNTVTNCSILGSSTSTLATVSATIVFATGTTTGNDNNIISNNNIGPAGANLPSKAIIGSGTSSVIENDNVQITGNNIFDFFLPGGSLSGINILTGDEAWTIHNNKFYQASTKTFTATALRYAAVTLNNSTGGFTVSGNTIGFAAANGTGVTTITGSTNEIRGIDSASVRTTAPATVISNNTITAINQTTARNSTTTASSCFIAVSMGTTDGLINATGNTVGSLDGSSTIVVNQTSTTASTAPVIGFYNFSFFNTDISNNNIGNITIQSTGTTTGFRGILVNTTTGVTATIGNNTIANITDTEVGSYAMYGIQTALPNATITGNTIRNFTGASNGAALIIAAGILVSGSTGSNTISQNTIHSLSNSSGAAANSIYGMSLSLPAATNLVSRNYIHSNSLTSTVTGTQVWGISAGATGTTTYQNNVIRLGLDAAGGSVTLPTSIIGIRDAAGSTNQYYHNSIYVGGTGVLATPTASNSYCLFSDVVTVTRNYSNNIFWNARSNAVGGGVAHLAIRLGGTTANPAGLTSNFNDLYFSGTDGATGVFNAVVVPTLAAWRTATGQDGNSFAFDPQFIAPNGTAATGDLHIHPTNPTPVEGSGILIAAVTDDFDGQTRSGLTPVDIGADAGNFTALDISAPGIAYTALSNTSSVANRVISANITDQTGVASGANTPRIYFKKSTDASYVSTQCAFTSGTPQNGNYDCTINNALVGGGGVASGDIIQYFIVAQDTLGNLASNPSGATGADVNTVTFGGAPNSYTIVPLITGKKTVGVGGDYATLTAAIAALNGAEIGGPVQLTLTDATYPSETFPLTVNALAGSSATNTVTIKPGPSVTASISGSSASCVLNLNGADWVRVDGSNTVGGTTRDLTIANTNAGTASAVVCMTSTGVNAGATNNIVKNLNLVGTTVTATDGTLFGVFSGTSTISATSAGADNDNNTIQNNNITKVAVGIYSGGASAANKNTGTVITQNVMNAASPNNLNKGGILVNFEDGVQVTQNDISVFRHDGTTGQTGTAYGIAIGLVPNNSVTTFTGSDVINASILRNKINGITQLNSTGYSTMGIVVNQVTSGTTLVANNMVSGVISPSTASDFSAGIVAGGGTGSTTNIYHNSVYLTGARGTGSAFPSYGLAIGSSNPIINIRNNIFANIQTSGAAGKQYAIASIGSTFTNMVSNHNDLFVTGAASFVGQTGGLGTSGTDRATLADWQTATGQDSTLAPESISTDPLFVSTSDLHLASTSSPAFDTGVAGTGVTTDFDGETRPSGAAPDMGADEIQVSADLSITKTDGVTTATPGGSVTYTITASNAGPSGATGATVADTFPASLTATWTCVGAGGGTCTASGSGNINDSVNLPAGGSVTYTASCTISAGATGSLANTATVAAPAGVTDPTPGNNTATDTDTLSASANLSITKTDGVTTATPGGSVTYTITASNAGPSNTTATVADTFPASLTATWTCVGAGGGTCTAAGAGNINDAVTLPAGGSVTYTASATISASATGSLSNTATVTGAASDPVPGNNSATDSDTLSASADLSITKTDGVTAVSPGGSTTYTITASNSGPSNATGATVADTFPASLTGTWTCVGAGGGTCTASGSGNINDSVNLPSGGSVTYTVSCTISGAATGSISNTATVTAPGGVTDPVPANNSATDTDTVNAAAVGPVTVTSSAGTTTPTDYATLKLAFDAINAGTHQGVITVDIVQNTDEGTTPATLTSSGAGSAVYTSINIRPTTDGRTITGNPATGFGVIQLKGADNVTIDGDNPNTAGTNRNLTVNNTNTATAIAGSVIRVATAAAVVTSADNITIRNLILNGNVTGGNSSLITSNTGSSNSSFGIYAGGNGGATATDAPTAITSVTANTAPTGTTINNLIVDNNAINQTARAVVFNGATAGVSTGIGIFNNTIGGSGTLTGNAPFTSPATTVYSKGIWVAGTTVYTISGNTIQNILSYILTTPIQAIEINTATGAGPHTISNNTITGVAQNSATATAARGIVISQSGGPYTISGNNVSNIQGVLTGVSAATVAVGIEVSTTAASATISGNKVTKIYNLNAGTTGARGINIAAGSNVTVQNNFVSDVLTNMTGGIAFDSTFSPIGIRVAAGTGHKIYHNSVHMSGTPFGTANSSILSAAFGIVATTQTGMDVRDNIFSNIMTGGTTSIAHVSMFLPTNATSPMTLTLNNNDYNSGPSATTQGIAQAGTTAGTGFYLASNFNAAVTTPASNLRALTTLLGPGTNDDSSKVVDPLFFSSTDLHITDASPMIDAAVNVGVTTDIDAQSRPNGAAVEIGADEFYPAPGSLQLSSATYSGNEGTNLPITVTRTGGATGTVGATLTLANGSATGGAACGAGVDYVNPGPQVLSFGDNVTSQIVNVQLCSDGALADPNETFTATLSAATGGATLGSPLVATATIVDVPPPFNGSVNVGTGETYTSLTNPGGIFDTLNFAGATGNVVINITSDLTGESGSIPLNQVAGGFTVTIKPSGAPRSITSTASAVSVIKINDADNVTIDGSTSGGTDRSLTLINTNPAASTAVIWLGNSANGAQNNTIKNLILQGGTDQSVANVFNFGILMSSSASILTGGADNDNNTYTNNFVKKVSVGIASIGGLATNKNENTVISNNLIGPAAFGSDEVSTLGILIFNENAPQITGNELRFIGDGATTGGSSGRDHVGISLCTGSASWSGTSAPTVVGTVTNANIARNRIHDIVDRATFSAVGIVENCTNTGNPTNNTIANNFIYNILSNGTVPDQGVGIGMANSNTDTVAFNSVYMAGDVDPGAATSSDTSSFGISVALSTNTNLTVKDNISVMNLTSNTGTLLHAAINIPTAFAWGTGGSNNNDWFGTAGNTQARVGATGGSTGTFYATLALWQAATSQDANSISADPTFVSATDLHVQAGSPVLAAGSTIAGITTDIDGETRDNPPDIGADEIVAVAAMADLAITKTDGVTTVTAGGSTTYTITASNAGPSAATGATVSDTFPAVLTGTWTCVGAGGGTCTASGSGNINDTVNLPAGGSVTYTVSATISGAATGSLVNTATVAAPGGVTDPTPGNNSATDSDTIGASADLAITKTDGVTTVFPGGSTTYTITASNAGPSNATGATVADTCPAVLTGTWTCVGAGGGTCTASGSGNINDTVNLPSGGSVTYTVSATISGAATGTVSNTATVTAPGGVTDPNPGNNSATDIDTVGALPGMTISDARVTEGNEGNKNMTFTVTFNGGGAASAHYHTVNGTATADVSPPIAPEVAHGNDYVPEQNGIVSFGSNPNPEGGSPQTRTFNIIVHGDTFKEPNEYFSVVLDTPIGAQITDSTGYGVIVDEDRGYIADIDHDQKTDITVFRPSDQNWYTLSSVSGGPIYLNFGLAIDKPVPGDYDGDGIQDYAVRRPGAQNTWYVQFSHDFSLQQFGWGIDADLSVQADYDGDDKTDVAVFRNGTWLIRRSSDSAIQTAFFGQAGDIPVPGDFDGDGKADFTVYRSGTWYTQRSSDGSVVAQPWGNATDKPVAGDFDGDGRFDYAVFRNGTWYILGSLNTNLVAEFWGQAGDIPVVGDYDGDGTSDVEVFRP